MDFNLFSLINIKSTWFSRTRRKVIFTEWLLGLFYICSVSSPTISLTLLMNLSFEINYEHHIAWSKEGIEEHLKWIKHGQLNVNKFGPDINNRIQYFAEKYLNVANKHVLVIGSILPWIESILLTLGVGHITTLEYEPYPSTHDKISTISPEDFSKLVIANKAPVFDAMVSFSSIEHSGLGR